MWPRRLLLEPTPFTLAPPLLSHWGASCASNAIQVNVAWGICTTDPMLSKRINPDIGTKRLVNVLPAWSTELKEILEGMGLNTLENLRGNRLQLRGVGLSDSELDILGVRTAGV